MAEIRIVIAQRGWVFVGRVSREEHEVVMRDAKNIRRWGTNGRPRRIVVGTEDGNRTRRGRHRASAPTAGHRADRRRPEVLGEEAWTLIESCALRARRPLRDRGARRPRAQNVAAGFRSPELRRGRVRALGSNSATATATTTRQRQATAPATATATAAATATATAPATATAAGDGDGYGNFWLRLRLRLRQRLAPATATLRRRLRPQISISQASETISYRFRSPR